MAFGEKMKSALKKQADVEIYPGYLSLSMAQFFSLQNWPGFTTWMKTPVRQPGAISPEAPPCQPKRAGETQGDSISELLSEARRREDATARSFRTWFTK